MKEITLKEWSAYLPYGLKGELQFDKSEDFELQDWVIDLSKFKKDAIWKLCGYADTDLHIPLGDGEFNGWLWRNEYTYVNFHSGQTDFVEENKFLIQKHKQCQENKPR